MTEITTSMLEFFDKAERPKDLEELTRAKAAPLGRPIDVTLDDLERKKPEGANAYYNIENFFKFVYSPSGRISRFFFRVQYYKVTW